MGILTKLLEPKAATFSPLENFWYENIGPASASGVTINPQTALAISTVFACVRIISQTLAMLPLIVYQRLPDGGKERASNHPVFDVLHARPNVRQSSFQFREMLMGHALLRGNAYARIVPGPRGFVDQLIPLHPDRTTPRLAEDETVHYEFRRKDGQTEILLQDEVFHISTLSDDSIQGMSLVALARDSFGLTKATENYGNQSLAAGQTPAGVLKMPGHLSSEGHDRLRTDWKERHGGIKGSQNIAILEDGLEWQTLGMTNEDAQLLETRSHQVEEVASWFGVPLSLLQHTEKSTSWGTGIAQLTHGFVIYTMQPWFTRWEQEISQDLILNKDRFFAEFVLEGLMRGDPETRSKFYQIMLRNRVFTPNEVRKLENLNPLPGLDEPLVLKPAPLSPAPRQNNNALTQELASAAAARVVRKEAAAVSQAAKSQLDDPEGYQEWAGKFWEAHATYVVEVLGLDDDGAGEYVTRCGALSLEQLDATTEDRTAELANMVLERGGEPTPVVTVVSKKVVRDERGRISDVIERTETQGEAF